MENANNSRSPIARAIPVIIFFVGLLGIYYLYQYLFGPSTSNEYVLLSEEKAADTTTPISITADKLPPIYEGGEFTFSTWFYVSNWKHRSDKYKSIFRMGGSSGESLSSTSFDTMRIYLGGMKPKLHIRIQTTAPPDSDPTVNLMENTRNGLFNQSQTSDSATLMCDLPEVDLQRWVNLVVTVNGRTTDVYMDGKLVRSCVLPSFYKVDSANFKAHLFPDGGFGGYMTSTRMYDTALNPDTVYRNYIAGPDAITNLGDWIRSLFKFSVNVSVDAK